MCYVLATLLATLLAGCTGTADVIRALATDPATVCAQIVTTSGVVRIARTAIPQGKVTCPPDGGMTVESGPP